MDVKIHSIHYRNGRLWYRTWQWPIRDMKTQLFILWNLNGKRYYFRFAVLFSIFSFVKAVLLDLKNFFQDSGFFSINFNFFKLRVKKNLGFFKVMFCQKKKQFFIVLNNAHVTYLLTTVVGSKKMNKMASMIQMVLSVSFYAFHVEWALIMPSYTSIPFTSGNSDRNSSIECYFNLGLWTTQKS